MHELRVSDNTCVSIYSCSLTAGCVAMLLLQSMTKIPSRWKLPPLSIYLYKSEAANLLCNAPLSIASAESLHTPTELTMQSLHCHEISMQHQALSMQGRADRRYPSRNKSWRSGESHKGILALDVKFELGTGLFNIGWESGAGQQETCWPCSSVSSSSGSAIVQSTHQWYCSCCCLD